MKENENRVSRRDLLRSAAAAGAGLSLGRLGFARENPALDADPEWVPTAAPDQGTMIGVPFEKKDVVRVGVIGVGARGLGMLNEWLGVENVRITALCDIDKNQIPRAVQRIEKAGQKAPATYGKDELDFENLCKRDDIDFIYIATPWDWHVPMAVAGMKGGKHVGVEVPAAITLKGCWDLVETSEKTRRHCMIMENCNYGRNELTVLNMVRAGLFGELLHGGAAYNHDLRGIVNENRSEGLWRRIPHTKRDGNLYPTHGLGPVSFYMDILRGDAFDYMVSMSSPSVGLYEYREKKFPKDDPRWKERYLCGDVNTSLIKTHKGRTIMLQHTVTVPRPYDRINMIQGSKGLFCDYPARIFVEGQEGGEKFVDLQLYQDKFEHPLWKNIGEMARLRGGHGGMDFIMVYRLVQCIREGRPPDLDVYDAAAWSVPGPLSEASVAKGSAPMKFPDFTRGLWRTRKPA